jgi:hypothetical protein
MPFEVGGEHPFQSRRQLLASAPPEEEELLASGCSVGTGAQVCDVQQSRVEQERAAAQEQMQAAAAAVPKSEEPPEDFFDNVFDCLIMEDPVFAMDGFTYERRRIEEWLASNSRCTPWPRPPTLLISRVFSPSRSPTTGAELGSKVVVPNNLLRGRILTWREAHGF